MSQIGGRGKPSCCACVVHPPERALGAAHLATRGAPSAPQRSRNAGTKQCSRSSVCVRAWFDVSGTSKSHLLSLLQLRREVDALRQENTRLKDTLVITQHDSSRALSQLPHHPTLLHCSCRRLKRMPTRLLRMSLTRSEAWTPHQACLWAALSVYVLLLQLPSFCCSCWR